MNIYHFFNLLIFLTNSLVFFKFLHIYQLKSYNNLRYFKYFSKNKLFFTLFCLILFVFEIFINNLLLNIVMYSFVYILNIIYLKNLIKSSKTPLNFTKKLSRIYLISILILFLICQFKHSFSLVVGFTFLIPPIANFLNLYDKILNQIFITKAIKKIKTHKMKIIAITGSNGKTSVKNFLEKMLSTTYKVQATPASFNTPIGIAKFINNELSPKTEFLILEYGARHIKDIKKLCDLFGADYGIITTISHQHIESFKTIENIFKAKQELSICLKGHPCVFNLDNLYTMRMYTQKQGDKLSVSINQQADVFASNIKIEDFKTKFDLTIFNETYSIETNLLGRHNILNICLATAMAKQLGVDTNTIINSIKDLQPVSHRLQLIKTHLNILDDSYNCSPASAKEALWVLSQLGGKKMIVTPGIIECGKEKYNINFNLGKQMAFCNYCIIVGNENKQALIDGIKKEIENTNLQPQIIFTSTLDEAKQHFSKLAIDDTLLLLNDLPDDYK